mgnify:CR=1 FL=1
MDIPKNIWFNPALAARRKAGTLTLADHVLLAIACFTARLFPGCRTDIGNRMSGVYPPEIGVNLYKQSSRKMLADTSVHTFGAEITYIPKNSDDRAEISTAIFSILQNLESVEDDARAFRCRNKASDMTDGLGHVTADISVVERSEPTDEDGLIIRKADPVIQKAETEVKT